ncbi:MAG: DUF5665 domain-containing protein [Candidatus Saccharimonadales bacterium]
MSPKKLVEKFKDEQAKGAPRALLEELFEDFYRNRRQIYWMNFWRGIFFGFGGVIGGTLIVALLIWFLSVFQYVPFLDGIMEAVQNTIEEGRKK